MTDALQAKAAAQAATLDRWQRKAGAIIDRGVGAAHAHAVVALTDTLKRTPDGRPTIRKARQSRSYVAAIADLDKVWNELTGGSTSSLDGLIRDARADFYRYAEYAWLHMIPVDFIDDGDNSPPSRLNEMRRLVLHGMELRTEVGAKLGQAKRSLLAALEMAARKSNPSHIATDILDGWRESTVGSLTRSAFVALSDSQVAIDGIAMVDVTKPEFRPKDEFTPN